MRSQRLQRCDRRRGSSMSSTYGDSTPHPGTTQNTPVWPWRNLPDALVPQLAATLAHQLTAGPLYVLIDPFAGDLELGIDATGKPHQRIRVPGTDLNQAVEQLPFLVEIEDARDPLLAQSVEWAALEHMVACGAGDGPYRIGGWLQPHATGSGAVLARQIGALLHASGAPHGGRYLRLADRRVLALLRHAPLLSAAMSAAPTLRPIDWYAQLQGIAAWTYLDANFGLQRLDCRQGAPTHAALKLDDAYWQLLGASETINRTLMAWQGRQHPLPADALVQTAQRLVLARAAGLREPQDCVAYAAEALSFPAFSTWKSLPGYVAHCQKKQQAFAEELPSLRRHWATTPL